MRTADLHLEKFKETFGNIECLKANDIYAFYASFTPNISHSTVNWRINTLTKNGLIQRIGRGAYRIGSANYFTPQISAKMFKINATIKRKFPYLEYCIWHISEINNLAQHLINKDICYLEVERDAVESVYLFLKDNYNYVLLSNSGDNIFFGQSLIVVKHLITGAPLQTIKNVPVITIEKLLVDVYSDKEFQFLRGYELTHVFNAAYSKYTINSNRMLRYASRREKRKEIGGLINTIK